MNIRQFLIVLVGLWFLSSLAGAITQQPNQDVFVLTLKYDRGNIYMQSLILTKSFFYPPVNQPREGYNLSLVAFDGITLYSQNFNFPLEVHTAPDPNWFDERGNQIYFPGRNETTIIKESANVELILPYYENAQRIVIKDKNNIEVFSYYVKDKISFEHKIRNSKLIKLHFEN